MSIEVINLGPNSMYGQIFQFLLLVTARLGAAGAANFEL